MTKLNSNGGDDKVDELLKERYDLAKDRIVEICTETTVKPDFLVFFCNTKISEFFDMAKFGATFCCSGYYKSLNL